MENKEIISLLREIKSVLHIIIGLIIGAHIANQIWS